MQKEKIKKVQKKDNQIKENLQKRDTFQQKRENQGKTNFQEREQKMRMSKKKKNFLFWSKAKRKYKHAKKNTNS